MKKKKKIKESNKYKKKNNKLINKHSKNVCAVKNNTMVGTDFKCLIINRKKQ